MPETHHPNLLPQTKEQLPTLAIYDLETTGMSADNDRIIQIAAIRMVHGIPIAEDCFCTYVNPGRKIPAWITSYTGIHEEDVAHAPSIPEALATFSQWAGESILLAHNGNRFDIQFLHKNCDRCAFPQRPVFYCDSMHLSWQLWGRRYLSHGLDAVMKRLQVTANDQLRRHNALGDTLLLARCVEKMLDQYLQTNGILPDLKIKKGYLPDCSLPLS